MFFNEPEYRDLYIKMHRGDYGKFKVGTTVVYCGKLFPDLMGMECKILASNVQDAENTEYLLEGFAYLVYEDEIKEKI